VKTAIIASGLLGLLLTGCAQRDELPGSVTGAFEQAFNRDNLEATEALFTDDAQILPQHGPVVSGRDGIKQYLRDQMTPVVSFNTETDMTLVRGDIGVEQGHYRVRDLRRGSDIEEGKYIHIWRKDGGDWKLFRVIYNTDIAPEAEVSVAGES
jgi:ketosteroid isomerase-like protein